MSKLTVIFENQSFQTDIKLMEFWGEIEKNIQKHIRIGVRIFEMPKAFNFTLS